MKPVRFPASQFPAAIARTKKAGALTLTETRYDSGAVLPPHQHENACFVVVLEGTFDDASGPVEQKVTTGAVIFRPKAEPHSNRFDRKRARCLNIELPEQWMRMVGEDTHVLDKPAVFTGGNVDVIGLR